MNKTDALLISSAPDERRNTPIKSCIEASMKLYFQKLNGETAADLYKLVIGQAEHALLKSVIEYTKGNQSKAAEYLGLNRGTLRKRLRHHKLEH